MAHDGQGMVHAVRALAVMGTAGELRRRADQLDKMDTIYLDLLTFRGADRALIEGWATGDKDIWLTPIECLTAHLIDGITQEPPTPAPAPSPDPISVSSQPAPVWQEKALVDFLGALGPFQPADRSRLLNNLNYWLFTNVK
jgi:hypothetical protein